jgi:hypothetical protein
MNLILKDLIGQDCLSPADGENVYQMIHPELTADRPVTLDFSGVRVVVSIFLNQAIGKLYADIPLDAIRRNLHIAGLNDAGLFALRRVVENSKSYYSDEAYRSAIDHSIDVLEA